MSKLLHILASPRVESYSTRVAEAFVDAYRQARPEDYVETLDLFRDDIRAIRIQGTLQNKPEQAEEDTQKAIAEAAEMAVEFAGEAAMAV